MDRKILRCYAEGSEDSGWEAICVDLDLAVQGRTFQEVFDGLNEAIDLYVETLSELSKEDRLRLINRRAPLYVRIKLFFAHLRYFIFSKTGNMSRHDFVASSNLCLP